jgi:hypothetical protein
MIKNVESLENTGMVQKFKNNMLVGRSAETTSWWLGPDLSLRLRHPIQTRTTITTQEVAGI